jgi:Na+/H+-translocating membrane pyrophosphatase
VTRLNASTGKKAHVDLLEPLTFAGLLLGSMLPYWFSAMTMKSVGQAANAMVLEIKRQFDRNPNLLIPNHPDRPDYDTCIKISTDASLREMVAPGCLVMLSPIVVGVLFGTQCVTGLLAGAISSGVQMAISASNTGGAWDNAKKYISKGSMDSMIAREEPDMVVGGKVNTKKSQIFKAAVTGDTVGDPLKDTSGPALNILMKLMAIISVVFADFFLSINDGGGLISYYV